MRTRGAGTWELPHLGLAQSKQSLDRAAREGGKPGAGVLREATVSVKARVRTVPASNGSCHSFSDMLGPVSVLTILA